MKTIAKLSIYLPGIVKVKAAEGETVVEQNAPVGHVDRVDTQRCALAKTLADSQIKRGVLRQVRTRVGRGRVGIAVLF